MTALNLIEHSRVLLAHLYAKRDVISQTIASLEGLVGEHPELLDRHRDATPTPAPVAVALDGAVIAKAALGRLPKRRARSTATPVATAPAGVAAPPTEPSPQAHAHGEGKAKAGQYDTAVLRAARDAGELGMTLADATRAVVGPGRPEQVQAKSGAVFGVLKRLVAAGQLTKDGRYYRLPPREDD